MMQNEPSVYRTNCLAAVCLWVREIVHAQGVRQLWSRSYHREIRSNKQEYRFTSWKYNRAVGTGKNLFRSCYKKSLKRNHPNMRPDWRQRHRRWHFSCGRRRVAKRAPLWVGRDLPRPPLILRPATPAAFSIEEKVSLISYNLLWSLRLFIDFF